VLAVTCQEVAYPEPGQRLAAVIEKQRGAGVMRKPPFCTQVAQELSRLRPEGQMRIFRPSPDNRTGKGLINWQSLILRLRISRTRAPVLNIVANKA